MAGYNITELYAKRRKHASTPRLTYTPTRPPEIDQKLQI